MYLENKNWFRKRSTFIRLFIYSIFLEIFLYVFSLLIIIVVNRHTSNIGTFLYYLHLPGLYLGELLRESLGYRFGDWKDFIELITMIIVQIIVIFLILLIIRSIKRRFFKSKV